MTRRTFPIELNGQTLQLDFDWVALAEVYERFGATVDIFNPMILRQLVLLGLGRHHPEIDQAFVDRASPPVVTTIAIVDQALRYAYDGIDPDAAQEGAAAEGAAKPKPRRRRPVDLDTPPSLA